MSIREYVHIEPEQENRAIAGYYEVEEELLIPVNNQEVLCILGYVCWDNSCCGSGGCRYVSVPGYIVDYKKAIDKKGRPVSRVRKITKSEEQKEIKDILRKKIRNLQIIDI
ncbi:MAG: hypothetical protein JXA41_16250 [Deltaproteobacteria bacterium]|nr:hypothetical protein [Deltaproteobacteria bacterium]